MNRPGAGTIAVIADIHGNADALRAVLADIDRRGVTRIVNLGDLFSGPLAAGETARVLRARPEILSIRGNHDRYLLEQNPARMGPSDAVAYGELSPVDLDWLAGVPATAVLGDDIALCHATPGDDETYWLHALTPQAQMVARAPEDIALLAGDTGHHVHLCAHTHLPGAVRLPDGRLVVNPGSVGCPAYTDDHPRFHIVQSGFPEASYALLTRDTAGVWVPQFLRVPYDTARMVARARDRDRPDWAEAVATGWITGAP